MGGAGLQDQTLPQLLWFLASMMKKVDIYGLQQLAADYASKVKLPTVILLLGSLGAGKTAFVRFFCEALGVKDRVNSPTFDLVNRYTVSANLKTPSEEVKGEMDEFYVYHLDLYRLRVSSTPRLEELFQIDDSHFLCLIEWADAFEIDYKKWAWEQGADFLKLKLKFTDERNIRLIEES